MKRLPKTHVGRPCRRAGHTERYADGKCRTCAVERLTENYWAYQKRRGLSEPQKAAKARAKARKLGREIYYGCPAALPDIENILPRRPAARNARLIAGRACRAVGEGACPRLEGGPRAGPQRQARTRRASRVRFAALAGGSHVVTSRHSRYLAVPASSPRRCPLGRRGTSSSISPRRCGSPRRSAGRAHREDRRLLLDASRVLVRQIVSTAKIAHTRRQQNGRTPEERATRRIAAKAEVKAIAAKARAICVLDTVVTLLSGS